jgi:NADH-quinone oxidoreductase subunit N
MVLDNLQSLGFFIPELILIAGIVLVVLADISLKKMRDMLNPALTLAALALAAWFTWQTGGGESGLFQGMLANDPFAQYFKFFLILASALITLSSLHSEELAASHRGEFYVMLLVVTLGMILLANSTHLVMLYLALELVSITCYLMVGYLKNDRQSNEAALKYLLFGAVASGAMLYGFSFIYGLTGSLNIYAIRDAFISPSFQAPGAFTLVVIMVLTLAGFGFKTAAVPFHFWCPDVYTGAPTPVTAFLSVAPKAAGFAIIIRFFFSALTQGSSGQWHQMQGLNWPSILIVISVLTMTLGNVAALTQNNLKRLLAYSSIAHAGYILMGTVVLTSLGLKSVLIYLFVYLFMNLGAFLIVTIVYNSLQSFDIEDYRGLIHQSPYLAVAMAIFMLSLTGIPPFAGFLGKLFVFGAVIDKGIYWFAVVGTLNAAVGAYYYMRVIKTMFLEEGAASALPIKVSWLNQGLLLFLLIPNIVLVVFWDMINRWTAESTRLFGGL